MLSEMKSLGVLCQHDTKRITEAMRVYQTVSGGRRIVSFHKLATFVSEYARPVVGQPMSFRRR